MHFGEGIETTQTIFIVVLRIASCTNEAPAMKCAIGRPQGEASTVLNVRIPVPLMHRLDRSLDRLETVTGLRTNRGAILRHAPKAFLESQDR
jgi:hypothetical protein